MNSKLFHFHQVLFLQLIQQIVFIQTRCFILGDKKAVTSMSRYQSKLQELTLQEMKDVLLKAHPELARPLQKLSERQVRHKYYSFVQSKRSRKDEGDVIYLQNDQFGHSGKESSTSNIKIRNKRVYEGINPESIRDSIIKNLPEMKDMIRTLNNEELYQLYQEFRQKNKSTFKAKSVLLTSMIAQILQAYPSLRDRIDECNEGDIQRLYNTIKEARNSSGNSGTQGVPISIEEQNQTHNANQRGQSEERAGSINKMRNQMRRNVPQQAQLINQFSDIDVEILNREPRNNAHQMVQRCQRGNMPQNNNAICRPDIYSMEHPYNQQQPKARTYLMVHTQYEGAGQHQKMHNLSSSSQRCQCSCCQNNTIPNMFSQLINTINSQKT